jgi:hypothetical protein
VRAYSIEPDPVRRPTGAQPASGAQPAAVDRDLELLSRLLDSAFEIPGLRWRFGVDALIGLIPGIGDVVSGGIGFAIITVAAVRYRLPPITLARMALNLVIDIVIGAIPFVGDVFDAWWKVNLRNVELIRRRALAGEAGAHRGTLWDWAFVGLTVGIVLAVLIGILSLLWGLLMQPVRLFGA